MKSYLISHWRLLVAAATLVFACIGILWVVRRQRKLVRADLESRGLVPSRRRHRRQHGQHKRNATLAESGGLPPVRTGPPAAP